MCRTATLFCCLCTATIASRLPAGGPIGSDLNDFMQPGTQPLTEGFEPIHSGGECTACHAGYDPEAEPFRPWAATLLGQSARDPVFWAALTIANQDATDSGALCLRCHAPGAFVAGRAVPTDGSAFEPIDFNGVNCSFCHRLVDPVYQEGSSPIEDEAILAALEVDDLLPPEGSNARYVLDPLENRRGPFDDIPFNPHIGVPQPEILVSPFHATSEVCWTCHDVSNPLLEREPDGTYTLGTLGTPHSTAEQSGMFPLHRTYSEWLNSYYHTQDGVQHFGRFGGNHPTGIMNTCQDCHMPDQKGSGCGLGAPFPVRPDVPQHSFIGSNNWVLRAVRDLFPDGQTGLTTPSLEASLERNATMLELASDLEVSQVQSLLRTRIINQSGHKLPTGFPDGRRIWIHVQFLDDGGGLLSEYGHYDFDTAELDEASTTVIESVLGIDATQAAATGLPEGPTFHFALANTILKDNRIPPQGFSIVVAAEQQMLPVGATYDNGQNWLDSDFPIPFGATEAIVTVYYQVTARPFIEFLRDANTTDGRGQLAYDQWVQWGMSPPVVMDMSMLDLRPSADVDGDGIVGFTDLLLILSFWGDCPAPPADCPMDVDNDGVVGFLDLLTVLSAWGQGS
ncbi:MAG: hypothetical protein HKO59_06070 [Phycisphaerales bacterium]|nr:hypothetical protein [Phycisphaerales bacterium]